MKIILASKSEVRKKILQDNKIDCEVVPSNIDEDQFKEALINEKATPELISKNLAELKANKISQKRPNEIEMENVKTISFNLLNSFLYLKYRFYLINI